MGKLYLGDCFEVLRTLPEGSVDSVVTDPPYGWRFMGKAWDAPDIERVAKASGIVKKDRSAGGNKWLGSDGVVRPHRERPADAAGTYDVSLSGNQSFQEWTRAWALEVFRVLKPGGYMLVFCGPRTYHRMATGVEDAGFEIRDQLQWIFGSGFPKSLNLGNGFGTALKPANEPIVLARKPISEKTVAKNVQKWGTGGLNIDGTRVGTENVQCVKKGGGGTTFHGQTEKPRLSGSTQGRFPANVIFDEAAGEMLDAQSGISKSTGGKGDAKHRARHNWAPKVGPTTGGLKDVGGASRFFYCAKTSKRERNAGLEGMPKGFGKRNFSEGMQYKLQANGSKTSVAQIPEQNTHPTVKPLTLMRYLCRLITPPGGVVLDPFLGSGTTGIAAKDEGFEFIGIEREPEYMIIAEARLGQKQRRQTESGD